MTNPVMTVNTTRMHGTEKPVWRTCWVWCPGCDHACAIPVAGEDGTLPPSGAYWDWNGDLERPTFDPSILQEQSNVLARCHSYIRNGQWQFLGDCSHELAGQTVDMVPLPDWLVTPHAPEEGSVAEDDQQ
jgi:hypothetical protein